jgi:uncharacterized protein YndB with AHSA1/START domain
MTTRPEASEPTRTVVVECSLDASPALVWRALTTPEILAEWLGPNTMKAETGERFTLEAADAGGTLTCEVLEAEPPRRLSYTWRSDAADAVGEPLDSRVTFELTPLDHGRTLLRVVHSGLPVALPRFGSVLQARAGRAGARRTTRSVRRPLAQGRIVGGRLSRMRLAA